MTDEPDPGSSEPVAGKAWKPSGRPAPRAASHGAENTVRVIHKSGSAGVAGAFRRLWRRPLLRIIAIIAIFSFGAILYDVAVNSGSWNTTPGKRAAGTHKGAAPVPKGAAPVPQRPAE